MKSAEDIESYLIQMEAQFESIGDDIWVVKDLGPEVVISMADPVVVFRAKVMDVARISEDKQVELFRKLLELNATEMIHGAYGLEEGSVVITNALPLENMDYNEFQATVEDIGLALANHYKTLSALAA